MKTDYNKVRAIKKPWYVGYRAAQSRCRNPKDKAYKYYGGRGIKLLMTPDDFKFAWFRDSAYLLKRASVDRVDTNGNYELSNIVYIEHTENVAKSNRLSPRVKKGAKHRV